MTACVPEAHPHRRFHVNPWLVTVVLLAAALVSLGAWVLVEGSGGSSQDKALVDQVITAINAQDGDAIGRLFTKDAVVAWTPDSPDNIVGLANIKAAATGGVSAETPVGDPITLPDPPVGFTVPDTAVDQHYVVQPVLIHDDPFVIIFDVRGGRVATMMMFEPFEPLRTTTG